MSGRGGIGVIGDSGKGATSFWASCVVRTQGTGRSCDDEVSIMSPGSRS